MTAFDYFQGDRQNFWKLTSIGLNERGFFFFIWEKPAVEKMDEICKDGLT